MKILKAVVVVGLAASGIFALAQEKTETPEVAELPPPLNLPLLNPAAVPETGNFYSAAHDWPPLPYNPLATNLNVPVYSIAEVFGKSFGAPFYLFDDRAYCLAQEQAEKEALALQMLEAAARGEKLVVPVAGEGRAPKTAARGLVPTGTDLFLDIEDATNSVASLTIYNPDSLTNNPVWDVFGIRSLSESNWTWLARTEPGQTNLLVPMLSDVESYYRIAATNDTDADGLTDAFEALTSHSSAITNDTDGDGLLDGWSWTHFGHATGSAGDLTRASDDYDSDGVSNLDEQTADTDPNTISFLVFFPDDYTHVSSAPGFITPTTGVPVQMATLTDSTNFTGASWTTFSTNITASLGSTPGWRDVWVGARGLCPTSAPAWRKVRIKLDTAAPTLALTGTVPGVVPVPMIQMTGYGVEPLATLSFDVLNATGSFTNERGFVTHQHYDPAQHAFTTNFFQCYDIELAPGTNTITLRATDWAGNMAVTNLQYIFSTNGDSTAPVFTLTWPQNGLNVCGDAFTLRGTLDDATATVQCEIVNGSGTTNTSGGLVERNGLVWVENIPLSAGTIALRLTATDAAGNVAVTNLTVIQSSVAVAIDAVAAEQLNQATVTVEGSINTSGYTVWVNGVKATTTGNTWQADNVPVSAGGTAVFSARAIPNTDNGGNGTSAASGNPTSAGGKDVGTEAEKPPRWYVEIYHETTDESQVNADGLDDSSKVGTMVWADSSATNWSVAGFANKSATHTSMPLLREDYWTNTWPRELWPNSSNGWYEAVTSYYSDPGNEFHTNGVADAALIALEHCDVQDDWYLPWTYSTYHRTAQTVMKLATGGKALPKRSCLFETSAQVQVIRNPRWKPGQPWNEASPEGTYSSRIEVGSLGPLDANGRRYNKLLENEPYDITPRLKGTDGTNFYRFDVVPTKERLELTAVTYANCYPVYGDITWQPYPGAHWGSNVVTHVVSNKPALYVSGSQVQAIGDFAALGSGMYTQLVVRGFVSGGRSHFTLWGTNTAPGSTNWNLSMFADTNPTANLVDFYNPMTVEWSYAVKGTTDFLDAGTSTNQVYVSWHTPTTGNPLHTVFHVACENAAGETVESNIVAKVWSKFESRNVPRWNETEGMKYWGPFVVSNLTANPASQICSSTPDLVKYADGRCGAWQNFFYDVLAAHGIASLPHTIWQPSNSLSMIFGKIRSGILYTNELPGQNNPTPAFSFVNHAVNSHSGYIYDPSYGSKRTNKLSWEDSCLAGFAMPTNLPPLVTNLFPDIKGTNETRWDPEFPTP